MKDKEMIEEMANCFKCVCKPICMKTADISKEQELLSWNEYIKQYGCKHYQPKLPKDSVVLSKEEKQEYENLVKLLIYDKPIKSRVYEFVKDTKDQARKETAEKILSLAKYLIEERNGMEGYDLEDVSVDGIIVVEVLDELAKQFGVEIKE